MPAHKVVLAFAAACLLIGGVSDGYAASQLEKNFWLSGPRYRQSVPACDAGLGKISYGFAKREGRFWNSSLYIVGYENVREIAFQPWAAHSIPRRYCTALAQISDGSKRPIHYSIGEDTGMLGFTWGVTWCVVGLDRNWAYNPHCRMALP